MAAAMCVCLAVSVLVSITPTHLENSRLTVTEQQLVEAALSSTALIAGFGQSFLHVLQDLGACEAPLVQQLSVVLRRQEWHGDVEVSLQQLRRKGDGVAVGRGSGV